MRSAAVPLLLLFTACQAPADPIDDLVNRAIRDQKVPGMTVAILRDGKPVKQRGYGLADVENRVPARLETVYELASVSKQFTAVTTLMLVDEGKIGLDDPVKKYFPSAPDRWSTMTVRHLLNHTSGLVEFHFRPDRLSALSFLRYTDAQQVEDITRSSLQFQPGTRFGYSNAGMLLLGLIVANVSGKPFSTVVQERILTPLNMSSTRFRNASEVVPNRASGYTLRKGTLARWSLTQTLQSLDTDGFGGLQSTVGDLTKWENAVAAGKFLKPETWRTAWTPPKLADGSTSNYGMGWAVQRTRHGTRISHSGHTGTYLVRLPEKKLTLIVLSNLGIGNPPPFGNDQGWKLGEFVEALSDLAVRRYGPN